MKRRIKKLIILNLSLLMVLINFNVVYGDTNEDNELNTTFYESGYSNGEYVGSVAGGEYASNTYINNEYYNVENAYNDFLNNSDFKNDYKTYYLPSEYYKGFLVGVESGFYSSYEEIYLEKQSNSIENSIFTQLPTEGDLTTDYNIELDSDDLDVTFTLDFGYGNFFKDSFVKIFDQGRYLKHNADRYTPYSNTYDVEVYNEYSGVRQNYIVLDEPLKISFTHNLGENVGIYQVVDNKLKYLHTIVDEENAESVYTVIPSGKYYGGVYVLLADEKLKEANDIKDNWNYAGLETYNRRGWLPMDSYGNVNPNSNITRGTLAYLIERNFNTYDENFEQSADYADEDKFYGYNNAINYCVSKGYLTVTGDNRFRPLDTVSYEELEIILCRIAGYEISFSDIDEAMKNNMYHKSNYSENKKSSVTNSEAVYALMYLLK